MYIVFAVGYQSFSVFRGGKKGTPIGQIILENPNNIRLTWTMRHRYRHGVPFGIDRNTGKVGLVKDIGPRALENYYVKVSADPHVPGMSKITTEVKISVKQPPESQQESPKVPPKVMTFPAHVKENLEDALIANLTEFVLDERESGLNEYFMIVEDDEQVLDKFSITESGLLYTKVKN